MSAEKASRTVEKPLQSWVKTLLHVRPELYIAEVLADNINTRGIQESAATILDNKDLKKEIMRILMLESHESLKKS
jgi:hypothetical protein